MTVDEFVDAEKRRLTVFARYMRQVYGLGGFDLTSDDEGRRMFAQHCEKADRFKSTDTRDGCANVGDIKETR